MGCYSVFIFFLQLIPIVMVPHLALYAGPKPLESDSETYNDWASHNRFHVGDTLYFECHDDSVLVVTQEDYENCITTNLISKFEDERTILNSIAVDSSTSSAEPRHCRLGHRLVIRVMVQPKVEPSEYASLPKFGQHGCNAFNFGLPEFNSTTKLSVAWYFMVALVSVFIVFYQFM